MKITLFYSEFFLDKKDIIFYNYKLVCNYKQKVGKILLRRFTKIFYSMLSICVAIGCVGVLTMTAAAFSLEGDGNRTDFTVKSLTVCEVAQDDAFFPFGDDRTQWCVVLVDATADTWTYSPYTYTVDAFSVKTQGMLKNEHNAVVVLENPISYSRAKPQDFVLRVYLHIPPDVAAAELVSKLSFTAQSATKSLGAIEDDMKMYLPKLDMAEQKEYIVIDNTKPAAKSAAGFF